MNFKIIIDPEFCAFYNQAGTFMKSQASFMFQDLINYMRYFVDLRPIHIDALASVVQPGKLKKKEHLLTSGDVCNHVTFFNQGYFRFYHYKSDGSEVTRDFYFAPGFSTSYTSLISREPSTLFLQAMEDMNILKIHIHQLQQLYEQYQTIERFGRLMAETTFIYTEKHLLSFLNDPAEKRYRYLLEEYPEFIQKIPLQYIASYLGITPETLSRIRKKIR